MALHEVMRLCDRDGSGNGMRDAHDGFLQTGRHPASGHASHALIRIKRSALLSYTVNCSAMIRSDRARSGSNSTVMLTERSSPTSTDSTSRTSVKSATAAVGRLSASSTSNNTWAELGSSAPRQRRGRNAEIGVSGNRLADNGTIGTCADRL